MAMACSEPSKSAVVMDGKTIFKSYCVTCHGIDGTLMTNGAKDLTKSLLTLDEKIHVITNGRNVMTAFKGTLTESQIKSVAAYTMTLLSAPNDVK